MLESCADHSAPPLGRVAAFFDSDHTVFATSTTEVPREPYGRANPVNHRAALKAAYTRYIGSQSRADGDEVDRLQAELTALCRGWHVQQVDAVIEEILHDLVEPFVYAEAATLINEHLCQGHDVVLLSAAGEEVVARMATMIGATHWVGSRMAVNDGRYTGDVDFRCRGADRAIAIRRLAESNEYDLTASHAYAYSAEDLPMLETVGHPTVVNPNRALRTLAATRGWPTLSFSDLHRHRQARGDLPASTDRGTST